MENSLVQARNRLALLLRVLTCLLLAVAIAGGVGLGSSVASQPLSSSSIYPQTTPTAFPDEKRFAIIAHALDCVDDEGGMHFIGDGTGSLVMQIYNGSIFSNACIVLSGNIEVILLTPSSRAYFVTEYTEIGGAEMYPHPEQFPNPIDISFLGVPAPDCSFLPMYGDHSGGGVIYPGVYDSITQTSGTLKMMPGLYCVSGDVTIQGGMVAAYDVTLYVEGDFTSTGSAVVRMHAPQQRVAPQMGITDVLLYLGEGSHATLYNQGYGGFSGMVYAPGDATEVVLSGSGTIRSQVIAHTVKVATADNINLALDPLHSYPKEVLDERATSPRK